jgi:AraC-like DNA-binding protein
VLVTSRQIDFQFSSENLPPQHRRDAIRGLRERGMLPLEPLEETASASIVKRFLRGASILTGTLSGLRQDGTLAGDDLFFGVNVKGRSVVIQKEREIEFGDGDGILLSCAEAPFSIVRPTAAEFIGIRAPRTAIAPLIHGFDDHMRHIAGTKALLALLTSYVKAIPEILAETPDSSAVVTKHLYDLIALGVEARRDANVSLDGSVRAARLSAIKTDIATNLNDGSLTLAAIAKRHRVTSRYIHKLFAAEGTTFTHYILRKRLDHAYRLLRDHRHASRSVISIAYEAGFNDLSYFNRTFRRHFGATPSDIRNEANWK